MMIEVRYEEGVLEKGVGIDAELCQRAALKDAAVVRVSPGRIEVRPLEVTKSDAEALANRFVILHLGDALLARPKGLEDRNGLLVWRLEVVHSRRGDVVGEIVLDSETGSVVEYKEVAI